MRAEMSPADRARSTARRRAVYEELHPEARNGTNQHNRVGEVCQPSFSTATAQTTGRAARIIRQDAECSEKITEAALAKIGGTDLDTVPVQLARSSDDARVPNP